MRTIASANGDAGKRRSPVSRRHLLKTAGGGFGMLGLASLMAGELSASDSPEATSPMSPHTPHFPARAKHVIFLFMNGGPSHIDTFDPKPELAKWHDKEPPEWASDKRRRKKGNLMKSPFKHARWGKSGIEATDLHPHVSRHIDDLCIIRSMVTDNPNHEPGLLMMNSGNMQPIRPSLGSWLVYGLGTENQDLPGFVVLCPGKPVVGPQLWSNSFLPGIYQGTHINNSQIEPDKIIEHLQNPHLAKAQQRRQLDLLQEMNRLHLGQRGPSDPLESRIESLEIAFRMQFAGQEAFDIGREPQHVRAAYGEGEFANGCLIARRLVERGVRMVQVYYGNNQPWDAHANIMDHKRDADASDKPIAALLADLKSSGLLKETLVIWGGEFGRTPTSEQTKGRDHHATGFTMWLAGGGVRGGHVHGATDELGYNAVEKPVHVHDLHATILHLAGLDHTRLTYRYSGRDFRLTDVHGRVVAEILA
jgi:hypothetical protein